jgi:hypothetical protein
MLGHVTKRNCCLLTRWLQNVDLTGARAGQKTDKYNCDTDLRLKVILGVAWNGRAHALSLLHCGPNRRHGGKSYNQNENGRYSNTGYAHKRWSREYLALV